MKSSHSEILIRVRTFFADDVEAGVIGTYVAGVRVEVVDQAHLERGGEAIWHDTSFLLLAWQVGWACACI